MTFRSCRRIILNWGWIKCLNIRVHKQTVVHTASLHKEIGDLKEDYQEKYLEILGKLEEYNQELLDAALR